MWADSPAVKHIVCCVQTSRNWQIFIARSLDERQTCLLSGYYFTPVDRSSQGDFKKSRAGQGRVEHLHVRTSNRLTGYMCVCTDVLIVHCFIVLFSWSCSTGYASIARLTSTAEYDDCIIAQGWKSLLASFLDITLNNLIVCIKSWSLGNVN